jgi:hypothetical protein
MIANIARIHVYEILIIVQPHHEASINRNEVEDMVHSSLPINIDTSFDEAKECNEALSGVVDIVLVVQIHNADVHQVQRMIFKGEDPQISAQEEFRQFMRVADRFEMS